MKKHIRLLLLVGVGIAAFKLAKKLLHFDDRESPTIRVRSGGSLEMEANVGLFADVGSEWRHDHSAPEPQYLRVTTVGTDCGTSRFSTNHVDIHCTSSAGTLPVVRVQLGNAGGYRHAFVRHLGQPRSQSTNKRVLMWPADATVVIDSVRVPGRTCDVVHGAIAEVIIEQMS